MNPSEIEIGQRFNYLVVKSKLGRIKGHLMFSCLCDCGNVKNIRGSSLISGNNKACGCKQDTHSINFSSNYRNGASFLGKLTQTYNVYKKLIDRCCNLKNEKYKNYGGRGIKVCSRWLESYENFYQDMGEKPKDKSIDRIDVNGNYEPQNCRWATIEQQANNKTDTIRLVIDGVEYSQSLLAKKLNVTPHAIEYHLRKGKTPKEILNHFKSKSI
jgi:hypothetical protein